MNRDAIVKVGEALAENKESAVNVVDVSNNSGIDDRGL